MLYLTSNCVEINMTIVGKNAPKERTFFLFVSQNMMKCVSTKNCCRLNIHFIVYYISNYFVITITSFMSSDLIISIELCVICGKSLISIVYSSKHRFIKHTHTHIYGCNLFANRELQSLFARQTSCQVQLHDSLKCRLHSNY